MRSGLFGRRVEVFKAVTGVGERPPVGAFATGAPPLVHRLTPSPIAMPFNKVILLGNLTRDPEVRTLPSGASVARLSLAINRTWADKDGNRKEDVTYVDVDAFGRQAEVIGKHFAKGKPIHVEGRLKLDQWTDKTTGEKKSRLGVVLEGFSFCGDNDRQGGENSERGTRNAERAQSRREAPPPNSSAAPGDDDVPF